MPPGKPHVIMHPCHPCLLRQADDISALFLATTHEGALLLAADHTPLMLSAIYWRPLHLLFLLAVVDCKRYEVSVVCLSYWCHMFTATVYAAGSEAARLRENEFVDKLNH